MPTLIIILLCIIFIVINILIIFKRIYNRENLRMLLLNFILILATIYYMSRVLGNSNILNIVILVIGVLIIIDGLAVLKDVIRHSYYDNIFYKILYLIYPLFEVVIGIIIIYLTINYIY